MALKTRQLAGNYLPILLLVPVCTLDGSRPVSKLKTGCLLDSLPLDIKSNDHFNEKASQAEPAGTSEAAMLNYRVTRSSG